MSVKFCFKFGKEFPEECLYIVIKAEETVKNGLSGKYYFHSMHKNVGVYIREPKRVPGQDSTEVNPTVLGSDGPPRTE